MPLLKTLLGAVVQSDYLRSMHHTNCGIYFSCVENTECNTNQIDGDKQRLARHVDGTFYHCVSVSSYRDSSLANNGREPACCDVSHTTQ